MGYRSEVILAVGPEVMPQFMITMAKSPEARELCWADHDEMIKDYGGLAGLSDAGNSKGNVSIKV